MMHSLSLYSVLLSLFASFVVGVNEYPIVLMHGFVGWGRTELFGYKYWGGLYGDLQQTLESSGVRVLTVANGPVSSSWDRVAETFAQLRGGTVDYGAAHSAKFQHHRYGRTYQGLYPEWGTVNTTTGGRNKVHIIAHSMGGQDARLLAHLLGHGDAAERNASSCSSLSPLFTGVSANASSWIASITTLSTPHDGTTLSDGINLIQNLAIGLVGAVATLAGIEGDPITPVYDLKLDQFDLRQQANESLFTYLKRAMTSSIFEPNFEDTSLFDLSTTGAALHNAEWTCAPDVYYMSYSAFNTYEVPILDVQLPNAWMFPVFWPFATFMGSDSVSPDKTWYVSDGVVNEVSMHAPSLNVHASCGTSVNSVGLTASVTDLLVGNFNYMGLLSGWDHATVIGSGIVNINSKYTEIVARLKLLPVLDAGTYGIPVPLSSCDFSVWTTATPSLIPATTSSLSTTSSSSSSSSTTTTQSRASLNAIACQQARSSYNLMCGNSSTSFYNVSSVAVCGQLLQNVATVCAVATTTSAATTLPLTFSSFSSFSPVITIIFIVSIMLMTSLFNGASLGV